MNIILCNFDALRREKKKKRDSLTILMQLWGWQCKQGQEWWLLYISLEQNWTKRGDIIETNNRRKKSEKTNK